MSQSGCRALFPSLAHSYRDAGQHPGKILSLNHFSSIPVVASGRSAAPLALLTAESLRSLHSQGWKQWTPVSPGCPRASNALMKLPSAAGSKDVSKTPHLGPASLHTSQQDICTQTNCLCVVVSKVVGQTAPFLTSFCMSVSCLVWGF